MLYCLAPPGFFTFVSEAFSQIGRPIYLTCPSPAKKRVDPFRIKALTSGLKRDVKGILLIVSKRMGPRRAVPASVINGIPVGLLFANKVDDLYPWRTSVIERRTNCRDWSVMAMRRAPYLECARRFIRKLRQLQGPIVRSWLADKVTWYELCERLAMGPQLAVYFGHATSAGFSGYLGLKWDKVSGVPLVAPCNWMVSFACDVLKCESKGLPFGSRWVCEGRARAFWGAVGSISTVANNSLAEIFGDILITHQPMYIGKALTELWKEVQLLRDRNVAQAFGCYRLIGDPLQPLI